jgi:hypothetical protein
MEDVSEEMKSDMSALLEVNGLDYRLPPSLSVATSRAMKTYRAQENSYLMGKQRIHMTLSTGAAYVDLLNSYLRFDLVFPATVPSDVRLPPHTSLANMFSQIIVTHSSGVEIERIRENLGEWIQIEEYYCKSKDRRRVEGSLYKLNDTAYSSHIFNGLSRQTAAAYGIVSGVSAATPPVVTGTPVEIQRGVPNNIGATNPFSSVNSEVGGFTVRCAIPLKMLCGVFKNPNLAPSFLVAGLQIELDTYSPDRFFISGDYSTGAPSGTPENDSFGAEDVVLRDVELEVECFQLTDSISRKLSQISAASGLEWNFTGLHTHSVQVQGSDLTMQVTRAMSRADSIIVKTRSVSDLNVLWRDSFGSQPWVRGAKEGGGNTTDTENTGNLDLSGNMVAAQVQLGSQYIPSRALKYTEEFIHSALKTFSLFRRHDEPVGVDEAEYSGFRVTKNAGSAADKWLYGLGILAIPLESSSTLGQSGAAISAQRTANVNMTWLSSVPNRQVDLFVPHTKLATLFLDSVVVRS